MTDFEKSASRVRRKQSVNSCESRKGYKTNFFSREPFWQIWDFWWIFSSCFVKTAFYLSSNFLMESNICEWIIHWLFFLDIGRKLSRFWRNCFRTVVQTAFYMSQGETLVLFNFWGENFVSENFCSFQWINGFRDKPYLFFSPNSGKVLKAAF